MNALKPVSDMNNNRSKTTENMQFDSGVYYKLVEAEKEAEETNERFSSKDILNAMKTSVLEK